jgi:cell division transport system ATP-binding protein
MIELRDVSLKFGARRALEQLSFELQAKSFTVIGGPSGAGKSSLLRLLATFEAPSKGDIRVGGSSISRMSRRARAHYRRSVGYTGDDVALLNQLSCFDNVALPLRIIGLSDSDIRARVGAAMSRVGLAKVANLRPEELSGGQQKRLQIARAVVNRPSLLLADEPTAQLDEESGKLVIELFEEFNQAGVTVVIASHTPEQFSYATHHLHLLHGRLDRLSTTSKLEVSFGRTGLINALAT